MICNPNSISNLSNFMNEIDAKIRKINNEVKMTKTQKAWISFCICGILVTGTLNWTKFEKFSLGYWKIAALSWMLRHSPITWSLILLGAVKVILEKYSIKKGHLIIDDTNRMRSKSTSKISMVFRLFDKKTNGFFMGQNIVFLLLVTDKITIPVGFQFYQDDPKKTEWNKLDKEQREAHVPKSKRIPPPAYDPNFPTKIEIALGLLDKFKSEYPEIKIESISADAAYGSAGFYEEALKKRITPQIISQLRNNQKVLFGGTIKSVSEVFKQLFWQETEVELRGEKKKIIFSSARLLVESHGTKRFIVALKYEGEEEYRYLVASDVTWGTEEIIKAYSLRWLIEVFNEDWKQYHGWGKEALQQGVEGAHRGVLLSLLVDLFLLFHPIQVARIESKQPACTVGSLRDQLKNESLLACFQEVIISDNPEKKFRELKEQFTEYFQLRDSSKHMVKKDISGLEGRDSLRHRHGKLMLFYA